MMKRKTIQKVAADIRRRFERESTGHDWHHIERVWKMAKKIAAAEKGADNFIVELGALLHDIADWKFRKGDLSAGPRAARKILSSLDVERTAVNRVCDIVEHISFKGERVKDKPLTLEGKIIQDADRLDAIGALGVARAFAYGGSLGRQLYDPAIKQVLHLTFHHYRKNQGTTINHFYEKLLLLKDRMNTKSGKRLAAARHKFLKLYLKEFLTEWVGRK